MQLVTRLLSFLGTAAVKLHATQALSVNLYKSKERIFPEALSQQLWIGTRSQFCLKSTAVTEWNAQTGTFGESTEQAQEFQQISAENRQSPASLWHSQRRREMLERYGPQISTLERSSSSHTLALSLLAFVNVTLALLAIQVAPVLTIWQIVLLAIFPGSILSLWQLQILHDNIHGSLLEKKLQNFNLFGNKIPKKKLQDSILFWGSMPSMFGYYLYLKYGHLTHHTNLGSEKHGSTLGQVFESTQVDFEDGDVLFVSHRMKLKGPIGPKLALLKSQDPIELSISRSFFQLWKEQGSALRNAAVFAVSFPLERIMLVVNDFVVALVGRNFFFPNKPEAFHQQCTNYCRCATMIRMGIFLLGGWKAWMFLVLSETLWSIPPHPAAAMFVTNHGSDEEKQGGGCIPSSSTYAGRWYSLLTLGTNYHVEHHDFPTIPLHRLGELRQIAPEYYSKESNDNVFQIMHTAFSKPDFYACMDATQLSNTKIT